MKIILLVSEIALKELCKTNEKRREKANLKKIFGKKTDPMQKALEIAETAKHPLTDPYGMYTGVPADPKEKPVQDADDL